MGSLQNRSNVLLFGLGERTIGWSRSDIVVATNQRPEIYKL
jgi:hypothetical protein